MKEENTRSETEVNHILEMLAVKKYMDYMTREYWKNVPQTIYDKSYEYPENYNIKESLEVKQMLLDAGYKEEIKNRFRQRIGEVDVLLVYRGDVNKIDVVLSMSMVEYCGNLIETVKPNLKEINKVIKNYERN